jgi:hypothetical protein
VVANKDNVQSTVVDISAQAFQGSAIKYYIYIYSYIDSLENLHNFRPVVSVGPGILLDEPSTSIVT